MIADEHKMKIFSKDEHFMSEYFQGNTFQFNSTQLTDGRTNGRTDGRTNGRYSMSSFPKEEYLVARYNIIHFDNKCM